MEAGESPSGSGAGGMVKLIAVLVIFLLAGFTVLVIFDIVPRDALGETATKIVLAGGICVLAVVAMALILNFKSRK